MTFKIATGVAAIPPHIKSSSVDDTQNVRFIDWTRADRTKRQIIEAIEGLETPREVTEYVRAESLLIDALHLYDDTMSHEITEAASAHIAILEAGQDSLARASGAPVTALVKETRENKGNKMFNINTNTGGESGPFLNYKNRAGQGQGDGTWYLRSKDGESWTYSDMTDAFKSGFVADVYATHDGQLGGSLSLGFIKFNEGSAPERHIWATPMQEEKRRSEEKTAQGSLVWQNLVSFRVATGGGQSALLDVSGWSGYKGMMALIEQMNAGFSANVGKCPLVQYTGFRVEGQGQKRLHVPEFTIASWVDVPECLKAPAPTIATQAPAETPAQPAQAATPPPAQSQGDQSAVSAAGGF